MAPGSHITRRSPHVNTLVDLARKPDEHAGIQGLAKKSNTKSNEAFTKASTPPEALIPPLVLLPAKDLFTKFMKVFMETT